MEERKLPIGYWLKKADELLTRGINEVQAKYNLSRTEWQVLNSIKENGETDPQELKEKLSPFASEEALENILARFSSEGIIEAREKVILTDQGQKLHAACLKEQQEFRQRTMAGISPEAYEVTMVTLQKIVKNLQ